MHAFSLYSDSRMRTENGHNLAMLSPWTSLAISGGERSRGLQIFEKKKGLRSFLGRKGQIDSWHLWGKTALRFLGK